VVAGSIPAAPTDWLRRPASAGGYAALVATSPGTATLHDVVDEIERLYPTRWAVDGDAVGLVVGDPADEVARILFAVDPVQSVVDEAVGLGVDLLVVHHPLLLRPVSSVRADGPKGRVVHDLVRHGIALYVAHTNADSPARGVSESMAHALGLVDVVALVPDREDPLDKVVTFAPTEIAQHLIDALAAAGAGAIGDYDRCAFLSEGSGTFRPGADADPHIGSPGVVEVVPETRVEMVFARPLRDRVVAALRAAHPYEEPAFDIIELAGWAADRGAGRIGSLEVPRSLREYADDVVAALPKTSVGGRVSGDLERTVSRVAVAGGAGDFLLDDARASGADVFVTSDLRHHPASEFREHQDAPALIDVPHWAAEWTWLPVAEAALGRALAVRGLTVDRQVSHICTDPWNYRAAGRPAR
jgi:dinuclear metal center YbgI/SA1388 family protein